MGTMTKNRMPTKEFTSVEGVGHVFLIFTRLTTSARRTCHAGCYFQNVAKLQDASNTKYPYHFNYMQKILIQSFDTKGVTSLLCISTAAWAAKRLILRSEGELETSTTKTELSVALT